MKKYALYYIFVGIILTAFGIGILFILYGLYLYNKGRKWDNKEKYLSYQDPQQYQAIEDQRDYSKQYGKNYQNSNFEGYNKHQLDDEQLYGLFRQQYYKGRNYFLIGLVLSFILIGIPIAIYGFYLIMKSQGPKMELRKRGVIT